MSSHKIFKLSSSLLLTLIILIGYFQLLLVTPARAVSKVEYSVKKSDRSFILKPGQKITQTFSCFPGLGSIDLKLKTNSGNLFFKIKPLTASSWTHTQKYEQISTSNRVFYPFGFPVITNCQTQPWLLEIEALASTEPLTVYYALADPYPAGELRAPNLNLAEADLTFRLLSQQPFSTQFKNHFKLEIMSKLQNQAGFWVFYLTQILGICFIWFKIKR